MADTDFRFDPFRQVFRPVFISREKHVAQYFDALGRVGFFTREAIQRRSPSTVVLVDSDDASVGEVGRTTIPSYGQFRVDYSALTFWSHCFIEVHETRIGEVFRISYHGLGIGLNSSHRDDDRWTINRSLRVRQNLSAEKLLTMATAYLLGTVNMAIDSGAQISASGRRIQNITASASTDLLSLAKFISATHRPQPIILTGSGNWEPPANVTKVLFCLIGPGGDGSDDSGGGGGAAVYGVADLSAIGGSMFAYVVGVAGIATTMFGCVAGAGGSASSGSAGTGGTGTVGTHVTGKAATGGNGGDGYFIALATDSISSTTSNRSATSIDGSSWGMRQLPENNDWAGLAFGHNMIIAVATSGTHRIMKSLDGVNWSLITAPATNGWISVAFGNSIFVSVAVNGTDRAMYSADGETWATTSIDANAWRAVTYGNGLFVAVASSGTNRVATSPDGINWTARVAAPANPWISVTYGNGLFVAIASSGTNQIMTSSDGINWTARTAAAETQTWNSVTFGNGYFVAVSQNGTYRTQYSSDGINWTLGAAVTARIWRSVTYFRGKFVAVASYNGVTSAGAMYSTDNGATWTDASTAIDDNDFAIILGVPGGSGGSSPGGLGGRSIAADIGAAAQTDEFFAGNGGAAGENGVNYGGGGGAGGSGADGLILLLY